MYMYMDISQRHSTSKTMSTPLKQQCVSCFVCLYAALSTLSCCLCAVDLEGSTLPASESVRESAEGVVGASTHTDGDGQDDR